MDETSQKPKVKGIVDICFLLDATGSMQPCIDAIKDNIGTFIDTLTKTDENGGVMLQDWRACICGYRDFAHEPAHGREPMIMNPFTSNPDILRKQLADLKAEGGGDEPESLLDALYTVINRGKTPKGAQTEDDKWRYASDAARCIIVLTDASFHPTMQSVKGGGLDDVIQLMQQERIRFSIFAPEMECHYALASADKSTYEAIEVADGESPVQALQKFTADESHFTETLKLLAKSVSQSAAADIDVL